MKNLRRTPSNPERPWIVRAIPYAVGVVVIAVVAIVGAYYFDVFTEGDYFCGMLCHPNRPQYYAHEISPHAHVECGECHIGPGLLPKVTAKIYGVGELVSLATNSYERPLEPPVARIRPAEEICGQCHWPGKSFADEVRVIHQFASDETNSLTTTQLLLRIGSGEAEGEAQPAGVHWHIDHPVSYVPIGAAAEKIAWAATIGPNGELVEYVAEDVQLSAEELAALPRTEMNCLSCHNRAAHRFENPERRLNDALADGLIDPSLPYVKREGVQLLTEPYPTQEEALQAMNQLTDFYRTEYPQVLAQNEAAVAQAVDVLQVIYSETIFPDMNVTWEAYPDYSQHSESPGCFRCHDDQHINAAGETIPANCTLCHSTPVVTSGGEALSGDKLQTMFAAGSQEPASHLEASFLDDHPTLANESCTECHGPVEFGVDNSSFCANGACHGQQWPGINLFADFQHPVELTFAHSEASCSDCHSQPETPNLSNCDTCHQPPSQPHFGPNCSECHSPIGWEASANRWVVNASFVPHPANASQACRDCHAPDGPQNIPASHQEIPDGVCLQCHPQGPVREAAPIPHVVENRDNCLACHGEGQLAPVPPDHAGYTNEFCLLCHTPG